MALFNSSFNKPSAGKQQASFANPFSSAFAPGTAPVVDPQAGNNRHNKRKRTSEANQQQQNRVSAYSGRDTVKSAQQNIEKLMKVLDKGGSLADKPLGKDKQRKKRKSAGGNDGDEGAITMEELRRRLAEESGDDASGGKEGNGTDGQEQPKKKKIKHGLDGRPILPPGVSSIAELQGQGKSSKPKPKQPQQAPKQKQPQQPKKVESVSTVVDPASEAQEEEEEDEEPETPAVLQPMTSLQSSLVNKLSSAKFRWLNEQLYTLPSTEAWNMMRKEGGSAFSDYHDSHRQQTAAWPSPPLPYIVSAIRKLSEASQSSSHLIVDLGCGDASLAKELNGVDGFIVLSYDLVGDVQYLGGSDEEPPSAARGWVVPGDFLDSVPLPGEPGGHEHAQDGFEVKVPQGTRKKGKKNAQKPAVMTAPQVVDSVVCCLSLMGVNWVGGIYEACRILKTGGTFHVAEVTSRLISNKDFIKLVESFGFHLEEHTAPTTHFDLFRFTKTSFAPLGVVKGQWAWDARVAEGTKIMKGCVYKKR